MLPSPSRISRSAIRPCGWRISRKGCSCRAGSGRPRSEVDVIEREHSRVDFREGFRRAPLGLPTGDQPPLRTGSTISRSLPCERSPPRNRARTPGNAKRLIAPVAEQANMSFGLHRRALLRHMLQHRPSRTESQRHGITPPTAGSWPPEDSVAKASPFWGWAFANLLKGSALAFRDRHRSRGGPAKIRSWTRLPASRSSPPVA